MVEMLARRTGQTTNCAEEWIGDRDLFDEQAFCTVALGLKLGAPKSFKAKR